MLKIPKWRGRVIVDSALNYIRKDVNIERLWFYTTYTRVCQRNFIYLISISVCFVRIQSRGTIQRIRFFLQKTTLFTLLTLQYSIYSTLLNITYSALLKSLKYLHCFYLLIYLFIYLFIYLSIYYVFMHNPSSP